MKTTRILLFALLLTLVLGLPACQTNPANQAPYKALIITGQNNHSCEKSTPILKEILDNSGLFATYIAKSPAAGEDMSGFTPVFSDYDLVVLDYNGDAWPAETNASFEEYVKNGGGVVVYHAADNSFPEWEEYNKIIGLGGWGNRDENSGPYVRWKEGGFVRDTTPGRGGSHGMQHAFLVTNRVMDHPITRGLPESWLHGQDELYSELRGPAENMTVLATAYADTAQKGTGEHEPVLMTIQYGEGRVFHTTLGHVMGDGPHPAAECVGFIVTLQRGAEWAVTGDVTQEVPEAFPGYNSLSFWDKYRAYNLEELLECLTNYHAGDSRNCVQDLSAYIRKASDDPDGMKVLEHSLITFLRSEASADAKNFVMQELSVFGSSASEKVLQNLMEEEETKEMARFALERISGNFTNN